MAAVNELYINHPLLFPAHVWVFISAIYLWFRSCPEIICEQLNGLIFCFPISSMGIRHRDRYGYPMAHTAMFTTPALKIIECLSPPYAFGYSSHYTKHQDARLLTKVQPYSLPSPKLCMSLSWHDTFQWPAAFVLITVGIKLCRNLTETSRRNVNNQYAVHISLHPCKIDIVLM